MGVRAVAVVALTVAVGACAVAADGGSAGQADRCSYRNARVLLRNAQVSVIARGSGVTTQYVMCARATGDVQTLNELSVGESSFPPPAMALSGRVVAWGATVARDEDVPRGGDTGFVIGRYFPDATPPRNFPGWDIVHTAHACSPAGRCKIGSAVVRGNGAAAWISCPWAGPVNSSAPTCTRTGSKNAVFRVLSRDIGLDGEGAGTGRAPGRRELLDRGRGIDPRSLRTRGGRVYWCKNGRLRSALLE